MRNKLTRRQKEDRFLDYIATHKAEITRYLFVVLAGEILLWALGAFLFTPYPSVRPFANLIEFILWALPYFILCKLWVWRQKGDGPYVWMAQGLKFVMCIIVVGILCAAVTGLLSRFTGRAGLSAWLTTLLREILYFFAMMKLIIRPDMKKY